MKRKTKIFLTIVILVLILLAWTPWITNKYAINKVIEKLGGDEIQLSYLGKNMPIKDIPKKITWFPFARFVTFPSEAGWFVTFYGSII